MLKDNLIEVEEHIKKACEKSGRNPEDVTVWEDFPTAT